MKISSYIKYRGLQYIYDVRNFMHFGAHFPRYAERLFFTPDVNMPVMCGGARYGYIISDWPARYDNLVGHISPVKEVLSHFIQGYTWAETGLYERMEKQLSELNYVDGCRSMADVYRRYENLDRLYDETARIGRFKTQLQIDPLSIREFGGITLHIDANGGLVFSRIGQHRMAIALALGLSEAPFALGAVDYLIAKSFAFTRKRYQSQDTRTN
jgi:hypothetical protein